MLGVWGGRTFSFFFDSLRGRARTAGVPSICLKNMKEPSPLRLVRGEAGWVLNGVSLLLRVPSSLVREPFGLGGAGGNHPLRTALTFHGAGRVKITPI
jgi:hypothetical protein